MSKFDKSMTEIFDVLPTTENKQEIVTVEEKQTEFGTPARLEDDLDQDYEESRKTLKDLVNKGNQAIDHLLAIASESEHPRAFEVVATLIKNTAEANEKLMIMQKTMRDLKNIKRTTSGVTVDKAIFVGSTSELNKLIRAKNNDDR
jgi:tetrahydromethanopterin S-methyltransferase subunit A